METMAPLSQACEDSVILVDEKCSNLGGEASRVGVKSSVGGHALDTVALRLSYNSCLGPSLKSIRAFRSNRQ